LVWQRLTVCPATISGEGLALLPAGNRPAARKLVDAGAADVISTPLPRSEMEHGMTTTADHGQHEQHEHVHGPDCGHQSVTHDDHLDYLHDGHQHAEHSGHYDEHGDSDTESMPT